MLGKIRLDNSLLRIRQSRGGVPAARITRWTQWELFGVEGLPDGWLQSMQFCLPEKSVSRYSMIQAAEGMYRGMASVHSGTDIASSSKSFPATNRIGIKGIFALNSRFSIHFFGDPAGSEKSGSCLVVNS